MNFIELFKETSTTSTLLNLALISIMGMLIGKIKFGKIRLGIAGVLFAGLFIGHLGGHFEPHVLHLIKEFGLILFIYSIGIEIGPRFLPSLKNNGLKMNLLAASICVLGFFIAVAIKLCFDIDVESAVGLLCGAVTNTPSLGAAQSLITEQFANGAQMIESTGMSYAIAYPFGIMGIILVMFLVKYIFRISLKNEISDYDDEVKQHALQAHSVKITLTNPNLEGKSLKFFKNSVDESFVFSRISRDGEFKVPEDRLCLKLGDEVYGLCADSAFEQLELTVGKVERTEQFSITKPLTMRHIIMTNKKLAGQTIKEINLSGLFPANITRIFRAEAEIIPQPSTTLEFGDTVRVVGARDKMKEVAGFLGNSLRNLSHPNLIPLFIGIFLGILLGSIPIFIPGLPAPAKLGLAGGPLIVSLFLGHKGRIGKMNFYITPSANKFIRELGIVMFLACVGIGSGAHFWETLCNGGLTLMAIASLITFIPLLIVGIVARLLKVNYLSICGLLSGSMTDPPALEFANSIAPTQAQANSYALVYPVTMFLRILLAQLFVLLFA
jgi:putative transport protein